MAEHTIPAGIVRSVSIVEAGSYLGNSVVAVYVDGIRKLAEMKDDTSLTCLADLLNEEGCNGKVVHIQRYTCNTFFEETCLEDEGIFLDLVPELLQHLKVDQE